MGDLGEWGGVAKALIEKISDAIGGLSKPWQTKRVAKAEVEADLMRAQGQVEIAEVHRRAIARFVAEEGKKQNNIEEITRKAIPYLQDAAEPQNIDDDWIVNFFDKCRIVSDEEMQLLWAKVLAGEVNQPGTFSKRTVNFVGTVDKEEAKLFTSLCNFCWVIGEVVPLIFDSQADIYNRLGINFGSLTHLDDVGLVSFQSITGFIRKGFLKSCPVYYHGTPIKIEFQNDTQNSLDIGKVLLTEIGKQLVPICGGSPADGVIEYAVDKWVKEGLILSSPYPRRISKI